MEYFLHISSKFEPLFYQLVYMSIVASILGIAILIIRKIAQNKISSKWISRIWLIFIISLIISSFIKSNISIYNLLPDNFENNFSNVSYSLDAFNYKDMFEYYEENISDLYWNEETIENMLENTQSDLNGEVPNTQEQLKEEVHLLKKELVENSYIAYIPFVWLVIVAILIFAYLLTYITFEIKIRKNTINDEKINNILNECKIQLNIKKKVKIIKQDIINMPSIFGIFNIRILVNDELLKLDNKQIEYVFMHELAHYKRKDNWLNILITILHSIYFFNPIIFILLTKVKNDLELATDELAMKTKTKEEQKEYSKTLVMLSSMNSDRFLIQTLCLSDEKKNLEKRIDNIKFLEKFKIHSKIISGISIVLVIIIVLVFFSRNSDYMSRKDIAKLMQKNENANNYMIKTTEYNECLDANNNLITSENITYTYRKDNVIVTKFYYEGENSSIYYEDYNTNESISYSTTNTERNMSINRIDENLPIQSSLDEKATRGFFSYLLVNSTDNDYEYLGEDTVNNKSVYAIELTSPTNYSLGNIHNKVESYTSKTRFYIDKENGLVLRVVNLNEGDLNREIYEYITDYEYSFNTVTDDDVKKPNIYDYTDYKINYGFIDVDELLELIKANTENNEDIINKYNSINQEKFKYKFDHKLKLVDGKYQYEVSFNDYLNENYYKFTLDFETNKIVNYETNVI